MLPSPLMSDVWRYVDCGAVDAFENNAQMAVLAHSAGDFGRVVSIGGFLNVKSPDLEQYLKVVRVPDDKFRDKLVKDMREYVCTAEEVRGRPVAYEEFRDALVEAVQASGVTLERHA